MSSRSHFQRKATSKAAIARLIACCVACVLLTGCARRSKRLTGYRLIKKTRINHLQLKSVTPLTLQLSDEEKIVLSWQPYIPQKEQTLIGYNIYRFKKDAFVPGHPMNKRPIKTSSFVDHKNKLKHDFCYIVRAVIIQNNQVVETPMSPIAYQPNINKT